MAMLRLNERFGFQRFFKKTGQKAQLQKGKNIQP